MSLTNIAYNPTQTWANHLLVTLEQQAVVPMFGTDPVELGITGNEDLAIERRPSRAQVPGALRGRVSRRRADRVRQG